MRVPFLPRPFGLFCPQKESQPQPLQEARLPWVSSLVVPVAAQLQRFLEVVFPSRLLLAETWLGSRVGPGVFLNRLLLSEPWLGSWVGSAVPLNRLFLAETWLESWGGTVC